MNKAELLTTLVVDFDEVGEPIKQFQNVDVTGYTVMIFEILGDSMLRRNIDFLVVDEGQPGEAAYWALADAPVRLITLRQFQEKLTAYVRSLLTSTPAVYNAVFIDQIEKGTEQAIGFGYTSKKAGEFDEIKLLFTTDAIDDVQHTELTKVVKVS